MIVTTKSFVTLGKVIKPSNSISESVVMDIQEFNTIPNQEDSFSSLQITDTKREGDVLDGALEDNLRIEPGRGMPPYYKLTDAQISLASTPLLDKAEVTIPVDSNLVDDTDQAFPINLHIVNSPELHPHLTILEPSGNIDRNSLLLLVLNLINNHTKVCSFTCNSTVPLTQL
jgi:hypothetical protein